MAMSTPNFQIFVSKYNSSLKRIRAPQGELARSRAEQGKYKISLDNLIVPEHKVEVKNDGDYEKDTVANLKGLPLSKQETI